MNLIRTIIFAPFFCALSILFFISTLHFIYISSFSTNFLSSCVTLLLAIFFFSCVWKSKFIYIVQHELSHYLMGYIFRRRLGKFLFKKNHASIQIENPNFLILMAPYIIPLWFIFSYGIASLIKFFTENNTTFLFVIFIPIVLAHHLVMTIYILSFEQSDLQKYGKKFSLLFIITFNLALIYFCLSISHIGLNQSFTFLWKNLTILYK